MTCLHCEGYGCTRCKSTEARPLVVSVLAGHALLWCQDNRLWMAEVPPSWSAGEELSAQWVELGSNPAPGLGGCVLTRTQVQRLTPPTMDNTTQ